MAHYIHGIILKNSLVEPALIKFPGIKQISLQQSFIIMPITNAYLDATFKPSKFIEPFELLSSTMADLLKDLSKDGRVAYIETEYFGGVGSQRAIVWQEGSIGFAPEESSNAINKALKQIGVKKKLGADAFDTLDLGEHRSFVGIYDA